MLCSILRVYENTLNLKEIENISNNKAIFMLKHECKALKKTASFTN